MSLIPEKIQDSLSSLLGTPTTISLHITLKNYDPKKDVRFDINHILPYPKRTHERILLVCDSTMLPYVESKYPLFQRSFMTNMDAIAEYGGVSYINAGDLTNKRFKKTLAKFHHSLISVSTHNKFFEMRIIASKNKPIYISKQHANIESMVEEMKKTVKIKTKKGVNVDFCVGNGNLTNQELAENVCSSFNSLVGKFKKGMQMIQSVNVKGTSGKAVKLI